MKEAAKAVVGSGAEGASRSECRGRLKNLEEHIRGTSERIIMTDSLACQGNNVERKSTMQFLVRANAPELTQGGAGGGLGGGGLGGGGEGGGGGDGGGDGGGGLHVAHNKRDFQEFCLYENYHRTVEPEAPYSKGVGSFMNEGGSLREYLGGGDLGGGGGEGGGGLGGGEGDGGGGGGEGGGGL